MNLCNRIATPICTDHESQHYNSWAQYEIVGILLIP